MKRLILLIAIAAATAALSASCIRYPDKPDPGPDGPVEIIPGITVRAFTYDGVEYIAFSGSNGLAVLPKDCGRQPERPPFQGQGGASLYGNPLPQTLHPGLKPPGGMYIPKPLNLPQP